MEGGVPSAGRHSRQTHSRVSRGKVCQRRRDRGPGGLDHRSQAGEEFKGGEKAQARQTLSNSRRSIKL